MLEKLADRTAGNAQFQAELARHFAERGNAPLADAARTKARALFEQQLAAAPDNAALASELADLLLTAVPGSERYWIDDAAPAGAKLQGDTPWEWVSKPDYPVFSGQKSTRRRAQGLSQHVFDSATSRLKIGHGARLFAHVYLDPQDPPKTVMLQFNDGNWEHRAYWGDDLVPWGVGGKQNHLSMGPLPKAGEWVRLEVEAGLVGLTPGAELNGWSFDQHSGTCYWDAAGCTTSFESPWFKLAVAYAVIGQNDGAVQFFSKALDGADGAEAKKAIYEYVGSFDKILDSLVKRYPAESQLQLALARNLVARGKTALAEKPADALAPLKQARDIFTQLLAPGEAWTVLKPVEMQSDKGTKLELQKDGSIFVRQPAKNDTYTLVFPTEMKGIKGLRLEALADPPPPRAADRDGRQTTGTSWLQRTVAASSSRQEPGPAQINRLTQSIGGFQSGGLGHPWQQWMATSARAGRLGRNSAGITSQSSRLPRKSVTDSSRD